MVIIYLHMAVDFFHEICLCFQWLLFKIKDMRFLIQNRIILFIEKYIVDILTLASILCTIAT